jgi:hypothetical protein
MPAKKDIKKSPIEAPAEPKDEPIDGPSKKNDKKYAPGEKTKLPRPKKAPTKEEVNKKPVIEKVAEKMAKNDDENMRTHWKTVRVR